MKNVWFPVLVTLTFLSSGSCSKSSTEKGSPMALTELKIEDVKTGAGKEAVSGKNVVVHYTGWLAGNDLKPDMARKFDSSVDRKEPFTFQLGAGRVIQGWDRGV